MASTFTFTSTAAAAAAAAAVFSAFSTLTPAACLYQMFGITTSNMFYCNIAAVPVTCTSTLISFQCFTSTAKLESKTGT